MATKYGPRKKHNAGTVRSSTTTKGGSRTRKTVTVKTGNYTRSRSVNKNGTVRQTTTHKSPSGFWTRTTKTIGSKPSNPKAPKFIKAKPFKLPKIRISKSKSSISKSTGRRSSSRSYGGGYSSSEGFFTTLFMLPFRLVGWILDMIFSFIFWCIKWGLILGGIYLLLKWIF